jgi:hypothetical protein
MRLPQSQCSYPPAHAAWTWSAVLCSALMSISVVAPSVGSIREDGKMEPGPPARPAVSADDDIPERAGKLVSAEAGAGDCACESASGWQMMDGVFFTGPGKLYVTTISESAEQCRLACCYRQLGCNYFSFDGRSKTPQTCTLWVSIEDNTPAPSPGYTSGKILGPHCKAPAGVDPMHPRKHRFVSRCVYRSVHLNHTCS